MATNSTNLQLRSEFQGNRMPDIAKQEPEQPWHAEYMAALFESDRTQIGNRIFLAERLIYRRKQELLDGKADPVEQLALNNAVQALHALRTCLGM